MRPTQVLVVSVEDGQFLVVVHLFRSVAVSLGTGAVGSVVDVVPTVLAVNKGIRGRALVAVDL